MANDSSPITITGFIYQVTYSWDPTPKYRFSGVDSMGHDDPDWVLIGPVSFQYELPAAFNATAVKLAVLEAKKQKVRADFARMVKQLDDQINSLLAIEMSEAA